MLRLVRYFDVLIVPADSVTRRGFRRQHLAPKTPIFVLTLTSNCAPNGAVLMPAAPEARGYRARNLYRRASIAAGYGFVTSLFAALAAALILADVAVSAARAAGTELKAWTGDRFPTLEPDPLAGGQTDLVQSHGRVVAFFAARCGQRRREITSVRQFVSRMQMPPLAIVPIDAGAVVRDFPCKPGRTVSNPALVPPRFDKE